jgi:amino acid transporter
MTGDSVPWGTSSVVYVAKRPDGELASTAELAQSSSSSSSSPPSRHPPTKHAALGQWRATSIAGNDLLSSCLYTAGICAGYAGKMAPLSLLLVSFMLYFFRFVYGEVVTALALNGGSYTALVNITNKKVAALAACLSIISYVATAVVSALSAVNYLQLLWPYINTHAAELVGTVVILAVFAALNLLGMSESANVATGMFITHFFALTILMVWSFVWAVRDDWTVFRANLETDYPDGASAPLALYYGYAAAMLGITGFETAANYVEELKDGQTYIRVLRNMWWSVAVFNPVLGLLSMAVLPMSEMTNPDYSSNLLGPVAQKVGGDAFQAFICVDGFLVLCGSVLTAYVGMGGLLRRLSLDRCLPDVLLARNSCRGTHHWVILGFFAISSSLFLVLDGDVDMLGSVYNISFLSVMVREYS